MIPSHYTIGYESRLFSLSIFILQMLDPLLPLNSLAQQNFLSCISLDPHICLLFLFSKSYYDTAMLYLLVVWINKVYHIHKERKAHDPNNLFFKISVCRTLILYIGVLKNQIRLQTDTTIKLKYESIIRTRKCKISFIRVLWIRNAFEVQPNSLWTKK